MNIRVYISGKIGEEVISEDTRQKFAKAEKLLQAKGYKVFNPTDGRWLQVVNAAYGRLLAENWDLKINSYTYILAKDIRKLASCDAIYMLANWKLSPGATAEYFFALAAGKQIFFAEERHAKEYLHQQFISKKLFSEARKRDKRPWSVIWDDYFKENIKQVWQPLE